MKSNTILPIILIVGILNAQGGFEISGYVDASATVPIDDAEMGFSFDGIEVDLSKDLGSGASLRVDVDLGEGTADVEQAYVTFTPFKIGDGGPAVSFGKFNAPIGFELLDAPDMFQYSHSLVFENALPTNLSGVSVAYDVGGGFDIVAYLANGWDGNAPDTLNTFGGRLGWSGMDGLAVGVSGIQEPVSENFIIDIDATVTMVQNLTIGFEFNTGHKDTLDAGITGWLVMGNYSFGNIAVTVRQDAWGEASSTTISPSMGITEGAGILFEYRFDNDAAGESYSSSAIELTFSF